LAASGFVTVLPAGVLVLLQPAMTTPTARIRLGHTIFGVLIAYSSGLGRTQSKFDINMLDA
jgi:hypothetical protein